jgi:hypothetical protein
MVGLTSDSDVLALSSNDLVGDDEPKTGGEILTVTPCRVASSHHHKKRSLAVLSKP